MAIPRARGLSKLTPRCLLTGGVVKQQRTYIKPGAIVTTTAPVRLSSQHSLWTDHAYSQPTGASAMHLVYDGKANTTGITKYKDDGYHGGQRRLMTWHTNSGHMTQNDEPAQKDDDTRRL
ncbi:hypothetical protein BDZ89DRAFT_1038088 [Hymenopellis radicata]|nr:hypothetical protein BDZ89DRAFT_1038088 [Hymenopellis radicata]